VGQAGAVAVINSADPADVTDSTAALDASERAMWAPREGPARVAAVDADARGVDAQIAVQPELPFPDGEFDIVVNFVVDHVGRPRAALALGTVRPYGSGGSTNGRLQSLSCRRP
jgi:hypothetical protein